MLRVPMKARVLTAVVILSNLLGNTLLTQGMKASGYFHPLSIVGVLLLIVWMLSRTTLMSWADLSWILPVTSIGFVLTALVGKFALGETLSTARWAGTLLITAGMFLVGQSQAKSSQEKST
jgi:uncharacterized membrane protein